ncbi:hypothetical protein BDV37DRAFT_241686 [Aspergillus pseudonomiae]|uniref:Aminoglycoside phosphotransferase domain-containing protein n=1 Tax=Aspergillus pseudonomiae TaxID=1506151 RepID=A0A5N7DKV5_9EURO|nr:uncharacterized protein BDV37DRAFT_241686 [Aspergillus pseudonomiae]KAE8407004.1 hypothetical protein BDV37DRAFT_241686 [Aspergillus pseudonomiae]
MSKETDSEATCLPTLAEIEAATEVMSIPEKYTKVVRVNKHFAVKFGHGIPLLDAENMKFLAANSKVPVPKVYTAFRDRSTKKTYIIMQYIHGDTLQELLPSLNQAEKAAICNSIKNAITELRSIPPPGYLGMLNHHP